MPDPLSETWRRIENLRRRVAFLEAVEHLNHSETIVLRNGWIQSTNGEAFAKQSYMQHSASPIALTPTESAYLWYTYTFRVLFTLGATRTNAFAYKVYLDGGAESITLSSGGTNSERRSFCVVGRTSSAVTANAAHTIDLSIYVYNAGDTVTVEEIQGYVFWTREA